MLQPRFRTTSGALGALFLMLAAPGVPLSAQGGSEGKEAKAAQLPEAVRAMLKTLEDGGVRVDLERKQVAIDTEVNRPDQLLEYLLIHRRGKAHEALLVTEVKPSLINTGLLALGLEAGKNAETVEVQPPPSIEEVERGAEAFKVVPPEGQELWMTAGWFDPETGKKKEMAVEDFMIDLETGLWIADNQWIYLGSRTAPPYRDQPPVFMADLEGNLVSVPYMTPANHLVTMKHERGRDDQNWWISKYCPPPGTKVELVFHTVRPAKLLKERAERLEAERKKIAEEETKQKAGGDGASGRREKESGKKGSGGKEASDAKGGDGEESAAAGRSPGA